jgi:hypothetical protein
MLINATDSLQQSDRDTLNKAASKLSTHASIGSMLGLGLGIAMAYSIRQNRVRMFQAFRAAQKPTHVKFADGREGGFFPFPLILPFLSPCPSSFLTLTSLAKPCAINRSNPRHHTPPPTKQTRRFRNLHFLLHRRPLPGRRNGLVDRCIVCEEDDLTVS